MRQAFINTLIQLAEQDKDIWLLTADMGFGLMEQFATKFPKRYINVGVAEQNMIGVATGLALEGKKVFCYSIANFPTLRCLEQIRNDVCYHNLPICIVSGGAGLWYGALGMTHHAVEDIAVMRCLPNMAVVSPRDATETEIEVKTAHLRNSPSYLRMSRTADVPVTPLTEHHWYGTTWLISRTLPDARIIATGGQMVANAVLAAKNLLSHGIGTSVLAIPTLKPLDKRIIVDATKGVKVVITIEEHSMIGGLGSAVAEVLAGLGQHPPLVRMGTEDRYQTTAMSYEELLVANHLTVEDIIKEATDAFKSI